MSENKEFPNYGCYIDGCEGERCVLDPLCDIYDNYDGTRREVDHDECDFANEYKDEELSYHKCSYWKLVEEKQTYFEHTCPCCGHQFDSKG